MFGVWIEEIIMFPERTRLPNTTKLAYPLLHQYAQGILSLDRASKVYSPEQQETKHMHVRLRMYCCFCSIYVELYEALQQKSNATCMRHTDACGFSGRCQRRRRVPQYAARERYTLLLYNTMGSLDIIPAGQRENVAQTAGETI